MRKRLRVFALTLISVIQFLFIPNLFAQPSEAELVREIQKEMDAETQIIQQQIEEIKSLRERITNLKVKKVSPEELRSMIANNDEKGLLTEFNKYAKQLDELLLRDVNKADSLLQNMKSMFGEVFLVQDQLFYYDGAVLYYRNDDSRAIEHLLRFFDRYPSSQIAHKPMALALKAMIGTGMDKRAEQELLSKYPQITSPEVKYLFAHVLFNVGKDTEAKNVFEQLNQDSVYGTDAALMVNLISAMQMDPKESVAQFQNISNLSSNNPFVTLALARFHILNQEWDKAEAQYKKFYSINKDSRAAFSQYEVILSLLNSGKKAEALVQLDDLLKRSDSGEFHTTFLYLWADMQLAENRAEVVSAKLNEFKKTIENFRTVLPTKLGTLNRINELKAAIIADPSAENQERISVQMQGIANELKQIHSTLTSAPSGLPATALNQLYRQEIQIIMQFIQLFELYSKTNELRNMPVTKAIQQIDIEKKALATYEQIYNQIQLRLNALEEMDARIQRQNELERSIEEYTEIVKIMELIRERKPEQFDSQKYEEYQEKLAEQIEKRDFYQQEDSFYAFFKAEYDGFIKEKANVEEMLESLRKAFTVTIPAKIADRELRAIARDMDKIDIVSDQYSKTITAISSNYNKALAEADIIALHLEYMALMQRDRARQTKNLDFEALKVEQLKLIGEMQSLSSRIRTLINSNAGVVAFSQPMGLGKLFSKANLYYYLAEMDFAINMNEASRSTLALYEAVLEHDPAFYMRDAIIYNIGYMYSVILANEIEDKKDEWMRQNPMALKRPDSVSETEAYYDKAISAFNELIDRYPESPFWSQAVLRMGMLYFNIGADADEPINYFRIARDRYLNRLISDPNNEYYFDAHFHRGWTYLNSNDEESFLNALGDFLVLLTGIEDKKITAQDRIDEYKFTSIANIAYVLIAVDGDDYDSPAKGPQYIESRIKDFVNYSIIQEIIDKAIEQKRDLQAHMQVADFMYTRMSLEPTSPENPLRLQEIWKIYYNNQQQLRNNADIRDVKFDLYKEAKRRFNPSTEWYQANKDKDLSAQLAFIKEVYDDLEARLYSTFQNDTSRDNYIAYRDHVEDYSKFTAILGDDYAQWRMGRKQYLLEMEENQARKSNDPVVYYSAIQHSYDYNAEYPDNPKLFENENIAFNLSKFVYESFGAQIFAKALESPELNLPKDQNELFSRYRTAALRYGSVLISDRFKNPTNLTEYISLITMIGETERKSGDLNAAYNTFQGLLALGSDLPTTNRFNLINQLGEMSEERKDLATAEKWYREAMSLASTPAQRQSLQQTVNSLIGQSAVSAESQQNYELAATEFLRLADEFKATDLRQSNGYKVNAAEALEKAQQYQRAIDLYVAVVADITDETIVRSFFLRSWVIADSLMNNQTLKLALQDQYMSRYPSSAATYEIRALRIQELAKQASQARQVSELYLGLHDDVRNRRIDSSGVKAEDLFIEAIAYAKQDRPREIELIQQFNAMYPNDPRVSASIRLMAGYAQQAGDTQRFDALARELYQKDKNQADLYNQVMERELKKIYDEYTTLYNAQEWQKLPAKREEFKRLEAAYMREGLNTNTAWVAPIFTTHEQEYKKMQDRIAFLKDFDTRLAAIERGFLAKKAAELVNINANSTLQANLFAGNRRFDALARATKTEADKVDKLLDASAGKDLDIARITKAYVAMAKIYEHGEALFRQRMEFYFNNTSDGRLVKANPENLEFVNGIADKFALDNFKSVYFYTYFELFTSYGLSGYNDTNIELAKKRMEDLKAMPEFQIDDFGVDASWQISVQNLNDKSTLSIGSIGKVSTPQGIELSTISIPPNSSLKLNKVVKSRVLPVIAFAQIMYPFDIETRINASKQVLPRLPIDTLDVRNKETVREMATIIPSILSENENVLEFEFPNQSAQSVQLGFALRFVYNKEALRQAIPTETMIIATGTNWRASVADSSGVMINMPIQIASNFGIQNNEIEGLDASAAQPIWVAESEETKFNEIIFESDFILDTEFRSGSLVFTAADKMTIELNGVVLDQDFIFDYDPEPMYVFSYQKALDAGMLNQGKNTIKISVSNTSQYRGFVGEVKLVKVARDGGI